MTPNEFCKDKVTELPCRAGDLLLAGIHCEHWYEDEGCCVCKTQEPNLVIIEGGM